MRAIAAIAALAPTLIFLPLQGAAAEDVPSTTVVAKVDGTAITEADMRFASEELANDLANLPEEVKRRAVAEYLIDNLLFAKAAEAAKLDQQPEFTEQMNYLRQRLLRQQYFDKTLRSQVNEADAKKIYDERIANMPQQDEFAARHILVDSEEKAKELRAKIVAGGDFAQLAKENSKDPGTKDQGGMLGYFTKGQMVPEFEAAALKLQKGEVSEPVKTAFGWHIIKLEDRRRKEPASFETVKTAIVNSLAVRKAQEKAADLRKTAAVEYVDADIKKQIEADAKKKAEAAAKAGAAEAAKPDAAPEKK
jgi:peptidyl-prolyl cis-trans isomerase C